MSIEDTGIIPTTRGASSRTAIDRVIAKHRGTEPVRRYRWLVDRDLTLEDQVAGFYRADTLAAEAVQDAKTNLNVMLRNRRDPPTPTFPRPTDVDVQSAENEIARAQKRRAAADKAFGPVRAERSTLQELIASTRRVFGCYYDPHVGVHAAGKLVEIEGPAGLYEAPVDVDPRILDFKLFKQPRISGDPFAAFHEYQAARMPLLLRKAHLDAAPPPAEQVKAAFRRRIATLAEGGKPLASGGLAGRLEFPMKALNAKPSGNAGSRVLVPDMEALACRYWGPQLLKDIEAQIDDDYAGVDNAMDANSKRIALREVQQELAEAEVGEVAAGWAAIANGQHIVFRPDTTARVLLGLKV